jgi:hypothetical protein
MRNVAHSPLQKKKKLQLKHDLRADHVVYLFKSRYKSERLLYSKVLLSTVPISLSKQSGQNQNVVGVKSTKMSRHGGRQRHISKNRGKQLLMQANLDCKNSNALLNMSFCASQNSTH